MSLKTMSGMRKRIFWAKAKVLTVHRGRALILGALSVRMKRGKRVRRRLDLVFVLYADRMVARSVKLTLSLKSSGLEAKTTKDEPFY